MLIILLQSCAYEFCVLYTLLLLSFLLYNCHCDIRVGENTLDTVTLTLLVGRGDMCMVKAVDDACSYCRQTLDYHNSIVGSIQPQLTGTINHSGGWYTPQN